MVNITLFACPLPYEGHTGIIQWNALISWTKLGFGEAMPLIIVGNDSTGLLATCGVPVISVECDSFGTPLVNSLFEQGEQTALSDILAYVNSDIILLDDFWPAVERVAVAFPGPFVMVGQRFDLDITTPLPFGTGWQTQLRTAITERGQLHQAAGVDYFVYRRGSLGALPPFSLGRWRWDNWIIWDALDRGIPVIDATAVLTAIHQTHGYDHHGPRSEEQRRMNDNLVRLTGGRLCTITDATYQLTLKGIKKL